jgi:hypothetical protein
MKFPPGSGLRSRAQVIEEDLTSGIIRRGLRTMITPHTFYTGNIYGMIA